MTSFTGRTCQRLVTSGSVNENLSCGASCAGGRGGTRVIPGAAVEAGRESNVKRRGKGVVSDIPAGGAVTAKRRSRRGIFASCADVT